MERVEAIIETLCSQFQDDPSTPSLVLSKLSDGKWYGSLVRYSEPFGKGKQVLTKCSHDTVDGVLSHLEEQLGIMAYPDDA